MDPNIVNWAHLPSDMVAEISRRLKLSEDFISLRGVCTAWRHATAQEIFKFKDSQIPWLMMAPIKCTHLRDFFSLSKGMVRRVPLLGQVNGGRCFSTKGWLLSIWQDWTIHLIRPFSPSLTQIHLPPIKGFKDWQPKMTCYKKMYSSFISKCTSSSSSYDIVTASDFTVMVIYGCFSELAYCRPKDKFWTRIETWGAAYSDVIYHKHKFYAIDHRGRIMVCDLRADNPNVAGQIASINFYLRNCQGYYLVEYGEEDFFVVSRHGDDEYTTHTFNVFKVDLNTNTWTRIVDIGQRAIFLGHNSSFCIETSQDSKCMPNSIYFTEDNSDCYFYFSRKHGGGGGNNMGIYHLQDGSITSFYHGNIRCHRISPPMWVENKF